MQNEEVIRIIDNLKGRRKYEEKKATKLGFSSLYEYFEDKEKELELNKAKNNFAEKELSKKTCGCC